MDDTEFDDFPEADFDLEESPEEEPKLEVKPKKRAKKAPKEPKEPKVQRKAPAGSDEFGLRVGSLDNKAATMYSSGGGATLAEVKERLGSIKFNVLTKLEKKGFTITKTKEAGANNRTVTRYKLHGPAD